MKDKKKEKKVPKRRVKVQNFDEMKPALVDGVLQCGVGDELVFKRPRTDGDLMCYCTIKKIEKDGAVTLWDNTSEQWFYFYPLKDRSMANVLRMVGTEIEESILESIPDAAPPAETTESIDSEAFSSFVENEYLEAKVLHARLTETEDHLRKA